jgi:sigma-B regulation protein RsbU (phosphoserine phosphatase)
MILAAYAAVFVVRPLAVRRWVRPAPYWERTRRQLVVDFAAGVTAGLVAAGLGNLVFGMNMVSQARLFFGAVILAFFIGLDMALARERIVIRTASFDRSFSWSVKNLHSLTRTFALVAVVSALCLVAVMALVLAQDAAWLASPDRGASAAHAARAVTLELSFVMAALVVIIINLIVSYAMNLRLILDNQTDVLLRVSDGDFSRKVPVAGANEFGLIASYTNDMIEGLKERLSLLGALTVAEEVQKTLLPSRPPEVPGIEVHAQSIFSDLTGGDYYDLIDLSNGRLGVAVGDVSGHGVGAALLMASGRAFVRSAWEREISLERVLALVNQRLLDDVGESGRFMTMFLLEVDPDRKTVTYASAGHDPAWLYRPEDDRIELLTGHGPALGVVEDAAFPEVQLSEWPAGGLLLIGTDGVWETHNGQGKMFGKERIEAELRRSDGRPPRAVAQSLTEALTAFRGDSPQEDDVTLAVLRFE